MLLLSLIQKIRCCCLQEFREILERHRHAVDELNSKTRDLDQFASVESREDISQLVKHVNERWNLLVSQVENKQGSLQVSLDLLQSTLMLRNSSNGVVSHIFCAKRLEITLNFSVIIVLCAWLIF